jgi:hypothetical protein
MKQLLVIITIFSFLASFSQSRELTIEIQNIELTKLESIDSIEIKLTNQGFANMGERLTLPIKKTHDRNSLRYAVNIQSDSTTLKIYINKHGFIEIDNLKNLENDTLAISNFTIYKDCEQKGTYFRKTVFDNDAAGETDFMNYEEERKSEFNLKESDCSVPDSIMLTINGIEYHSQVKKETIPGKVTTGHGETNKFWFGEKKYFHFKEVELNLIRTAKIAIKKTEPNNK